MPDIAEAAAILGEASGAPTRLGAQLARIVLDRQLRDALVLGAARGVEVAMIAGAFEQRGTGSVIAIDLARKVGLSPSVESLVESVAAPDRAAVLYDYWGAGWGLTHLLSQRPQPQFDLLVINGSHLWDQDGFAFLVAERLLGPQGVIALPSLRWTVATSPSLASATTDLPEEFRAEQQVRLICEQLVKPHPHIAAFWEDAGCGLAAKGNVGVRATDSVRDGAIAIAREQAATSGRRALAARDGGRPEQLGPVSRLTGTRPD